MVNKALVTGIISFIAGALLVSTAAVTIEKPQQDATSMRSMTETLRTKNGDAFDEAFITSMIEHHEGAVEMAKLAEDQAKHDEIKRLSREIIEAQEREITQMEQWRAMWRYSADTHEENEAH